MMIYVFWDIKEFKEDISYIIEVPFDYLENNIENSRDMEDVVLDYLFGLGYNLQIQDWGLVDILKTKVFESLDDKKTFLDLVDNFFKEFKEKINSNMKLEIISNILDILEKEKKTFIGYDGIIYKIKSYERSENVKFKEKPKEKLC